LQDIIFAFGRSCSPIEEYEILWFYIYFIKTNSPSTLNRNGRISKSELYHTSQNLVNMIVLLEYFSTSVSVCIWNKLYAGFYLKDVMNMSLLKILNKVVYKITWRWSDICFAFLVCSILNFKIFESLRVALHKPSFKRRS
jgi:hypothetical protein